MVVLLVDEVHRRAAQLHAGGEHGLVHAAAVEALEKAGIRAHEGIGRIRIHGRAPDTLRFELPVATYGPGERILR